MFAKKPTSAPTVFLEKCPLELASDCANPDGADLCLGANSTGYLFLVPCENQVLFGFDEYRKQMVAQNGTFAGMCVDGTKGAQARLIDCDTAGVDVFYNFDGTVGDNFGGGGHGFVSDVEGVGDDGAVYFNYFTRATCSHTWSFCGYTAPTASPTKESITQKPWIAWL